MKTQTTETILNVLIEKDEDGYYVASVVELPGCHTQGKKLDQLNQRVKESIEGYLRVTHRTDAPEFVALEQMRIKLAK